MDIEFLVDGVKLHRVPPIMFRLSSDPPDASPIIDAIVDLKNRILALVSNQPTLVQQLERSVDVTLLRQIMERGSPTVQDVVPTLLFLLTTLQSLQALAREERTRSWINAFETAFQRGVTAGFQSIIPVFPVFFEFAMFCLEELHQDVRIRNNDKYSRNDDHHV